MSIFDITSRNADGSEVHDITEMKKIFTKNSQIDLHIFHFNARSFKKK